MNLVKDVETESFKNWSVNFIANRHFRICFWAHECESPYDPLANQVPSPGNFQLWLMSKVGPVEILETGLPELVIYIPWVYWWRGSGEGGNGGHLILSNSFRNPQRSRREEGRDGGGSEGERPTVTTHSSRNLICEKVSEVDVAVGPKERFGHVAVLGIMANMGGAREICRLSASLIPSPICAQSPKGDRVKSLVPACGTGRGGVGCSEK